MLKSSELILYKASAGSGKTYALAKEFLKIVIANPFDYKRILAVTFTRKATEEMKTRIIQNLAQLRDKDTKTAALRVDIIQSLKPVFPDIETHFDKHVALALELILHDYSNFNISTIDSFFQSIIRSFAKELDLPIGMEIELDTQSALAVAVEQLLKDYESGKDEISEWIEAYVNDRIEEDKNWKIEDSLLQFSRELFNEDYRAIANQFALTDEKPDYKELVRQLKEIIQKYTAFFDAGLKKIHAKIQEENIDISGFKGRNTIGSFLNKLERYELDITKTLQDFLDTDSLFAQSSKLSEHEKQQLETVWHRNIKPFILDCIHFVEQHEGLYISAKAVLKNMYAFVLLDAINDKLKAYKADENLVLISDTNNIISLLSEKDAVPFIFEKTGSFLKYILLDEFQDTSLLQWKGLSKLVLEILDNVNGIVLIVGDPKQSIYRWRGGKMNLIIDGIQQDLLHHWKQKREITLNDNYRSAGEIIDFNNAFFRSLKEEKYIDNNLFEAAYLDVEQNQKKEDLKGFVRFLFFDADKKNKTEEEQDLNTKIVEELVNTIHSFKNKKLGDIAILTRTNPEGVLVAQHLAAHGIPVVSAESLLLYTHADIRLLLAALNYIQFPNEYLYAVQLNYLIAQRAGTANTDEDFKKKPDFNYPHLQAYPLLHHDQLNTLAQRDLHEIVQHLVANFDLLQKENEYVLRFQDIVLQHCARYSNKLGDFLEFWEEQKMRFAILPPEGKEAVKILTIHKSKGLQFPVVIIPFADWDIKPKHNNKIWVRSTVEPFNQLHAISIEAKKENLKSVFGEALQQEIDLSFIDSINLLYVALTRAESELHVISIKPAAISEINKLNKITYPLIQKLALKESILNADEFRYGKSDMPFPREKKSTEEAFLKVPVWTDYKQKLELRKASIFNEEQEKGNVLHEVLSSFSPPFLSPIEDKRLLQFAESERLNYAEIVQRVFALFKERGWDDSKWQHLNERVLVYDQQFLIPDKLLISEQEIIVIDYKSGERSKKYHKQVQTYILALQQFFKKEVKGYLLYLKDMTLEEVRT